MKLSLITVHCVLSACWSRPQIVPSSLTISLSDNLCIFVAVKFPDFVTFLVTNNLPDIILPCWCLLYCPRVSWRVTWLSGGRQVLPGGQTRPSLAYKDNEAADGARRNSPHCSLVYSLRYFLCLVMIPDRGWQRVWLVCCCLLSWLCLSDVELMTRPQHTGDY